MTRLTRAIQGLILFADVFGVAFLNEVYPVLPSFVFDSLAIGWVLFVVDGALTFIRPKVSYYLGLVLALVAFISTVSQPQHYALVASGDIPATITLVIGSATELMLIGAVILYHFRERGAPSPAPAIPA